MTDVVVGYDTIGANVAYLPAGAAVVGGYSTGSGVVPWTAADWAQYPDALRYDQDPAASDPTADVLDVERGAATFADIPSWEQRAWADFNAAARPGQRQPAVYCSWSNRSTATAQMSNPATGLVLAWWGITQQQAAALVGTTVNGHRIVGVQFASGDLFDTDVYSVAWVSTRSKHADPPQPPVVRACSIGGKPAVVISVPLFTTDANGWYCYGIPDFPATKTKDDIVSVVCDAGSPFDNGWHICQGSPDFDPSSGAVRIVFKGDPGWAFTARVFVTD